MWEHTRAPRSFPAALMFADVSGSSELARQIAGPDAAGVGELSQLLNGYFGRLIGIVADYCGDVIKFAGDALLALWPCKEADELAERTLHAARETRSYRCLIGCHRAQSASSVRENQAKRWDRSVKFSAHVPS